MWACYHFSMGYFKIDEPSNELEQRINDAFWRFFNDITNNGTEVFRNDCPDQMSNGFRRYGGLNQFNDNYHYFKVVKGTPDNPGVETHRYRTQILAVLLEREFNLDFEVHHYSRDKDETGKYDDTKVIIIYADTKEKVKEIHQGFHRYPINMSSRKRGEIK